MEEEVANDMMAELDTDGDGEVDFSEFVAGWNKVFFMDTAQRIVAIPPAAAAPFTPEKQRQSGAAPFTPDATGSPLAIEMPALPGVVTAAGVEVDGVLISFKSPRLVAALLDTGLVSEQRKNTRKTPRALAVHVPGIDVGRPH